MILMEALQALFGIITAILLMLATGRVLCQRQVKAYVYFISFVVIGVVLGILFAASQRATAIAEYCFSIFVFTFIGVWIGQVLVASDNH
jgi:uncharacterized membrane protein